MPPLLWHHRSRLRVSVAHRVMVAAQLRCRLCCSATAVALELQSGSVTSSVRLPYRRCVVASISSLPFVTSAASPTAAGFSSSSTVITPLPPLVLVLRGTVVTVHTQAIAVALEACLTQCRRRSNLSGRTTREQTPSSQ